jgi:serine phosphatase RsbU (regulator of sigma subunit)
VENLEFNEKLDLQKKILEEKNKDITDSITYAKRIQKALMASDSLLTKNLPEYFVLYKPKDIVSGDFYWAEKIDNKFLIATCDCTGHGVPGAFMSLLGVSFLNEITKERNIIQPDLIFNHLRNDIIKALNPEGNEEEGKDGMDAVLCSFDFQKMELQFACANNPLWVFRNNECIEFKPDKFPIGMQGELKSFSLQKLQLQKGDVIYTFTDGFADQFGGEKGKKFKYKQLNEKLSAISILPLAEQKKELEKTFDAWKGNLEQVDDVLVIGIRI